MGILLFPVFPTPTGRPVVAGVVQLLGLCGSIVAAAAVFGFYRCWIGIVQRNPATYYFPSDHVDDYYTHPGQKGTKVGPLRPEYGRRNFRSGLTYLLVAVVAIPVAAGLSCLVLRLL
jgi:hypothetical protein